MYSMMNKDKYAFDDWANSLGKLSDKEEEFLSESESWVDDNISKVYWEFRDSLSDVSGERLILKNNIAVPLKRLDNICNENDK